MLTAWEVLTDIYARMESPFRPESETMLAMKRLIKTEDSQVVILGGTPIFAELSKRVLFIDTSENMLVQVETREGIQKLHKDWMNCVNEYTQADVIVGDGSLNAVGSCKAATNLLHVLIKNMRLGASIVQRIFIAHELPTCRFEEMLCQALNDKRYSEVRFLLYGVLGDDSGNLLIADVDRFINNIENRLQLYVSKVQAQEWKLSYFEWRGVPVEQLLEINSTIFFPRRQQLEELLAQTGQQFASVAAGSFNLAEYTPIFYMER